MKETKTIKDLRRIGYEVSLIGQGIMPYHLETDTSGHLTIVRRIENTEYTRLMEEYDRTL